MPPSNICVSIGPFIDHYKEALDEFRNRKIGCIYSNIQNDNKTKAHISCVGFPGSQNLVGFNIILLRGVCALDCSVMSDSLQPHGSYTACKAPFTDGETGSWR